MKRYLLTPSATRDLIHIYEYIARDSGAAAVKVVRDTRRALGKLASHPGIGHTREEYAGLPILAFTVHSYVILYRQNCKPLQVIRVVHGARDLTRIDLA